MWSDRTKTVALLLDRHITMLLGHAQISTPASLTDAMQRDCTPPDRPTFDANSLHMHLVNLVMISGPLHCRHAFISLAEHPLCYC